MSYRCGNAKFPRFRNQSAKILITGKILELINEDAKLLSILGSSVSNGVDELTYKDGADKPFAVRGKVSRKIDQDKCPHFHKFCKIDRRCLLPDNIMDIRVCQKRCY